MAGTRLDNLSYTPRRARLAATEEPRDLVQTSSWHTGVYLYRALENQRIFAVRATTRARVSISRLRQTRRRRARSFIERVSRATRVVSINPSLIRAIRTFASPSCRN